MPTVPGYFDANGNWISSEGRPNASAALPGQSQTSPNLTPSQSWLDQLNTFQSNPQSRVDWMVNPTASFTNWQQQHGSPNVQGPVQPPTQPNVQPPTQPPVTTQPQTKLDPFTSWMSQQGLFPYNQAGWSPDMGYNPAATGYNPAAMPNYTMDTPY